MTPIRIRPFFNRKTRLEEVPKVWLNMIEPWVRIKKGDHCWHWTGNTDKNGYPRKTYVDPETGKQKQRSVRRIIAMIFWQDADDFHIKMKCENQQCVNPAHMALTVYHPNAYRLKE